MAHPGALSTGPGAVPAVMERQAPPECPARPRHPRHLARRLVQHDIYAAKGAANAGVRAAGPQRLEGGLERLLASAGRRPRRAARQGAAVSRSAAASRPILRKSFHRDADRDKATYVGQFPSTFKAKVLVTGAGGFIGRYLVKRLLAEGQCVRL